MQYLNQVCTIISKCRFSPVSENKTNPAELAMLYIGEPDVTAHKFGADAEFHIQQLINVDNAVKYLLEKIRPSYNLGSRSF